MYYRDSKKINISVIFKILKYSPSSRILNNAKKIYNQQRMP